MVIKISQRNFPIFSHWQFLDKVSTDITFCTILLAILKVSVGLYVSRKLLLVEFEYFLSQFCFPPQQHPSRNGSFCLVAGFLDTFALPVTVSQPSQHLVRVCMDGVHAACIDLSTCIQSTTCNLSRKKIQTNETTVIRAHATRPFGRF